MLYARLVMNMGRDLEESMRVVAMCLFLERSKFVHKLVEILLESTDMFINSLANEMILCMRCIYKDPTDPFLTRSIQEIPLLTSITNRQISLPYFAENRNEVLEGLAKIMTDVCHRAVDDLYRTAVVGRVVTAQPPPMPVPVPVPPQMYYGPAAGSAMQRGGPSHSNVSVAEQLEREPRGGYTAMLLGLDEATINDDANDGIGTSTSNTASTSTSNTTGAGRRRKD
ncbi:hypothetical protein LINGRAPRIM_LOCUS1956 [Linum grandiflorum]